MEKFNQYADGKTFLTMACQKRSLPLVVELLQKKQMRESINQPDVQGNTALHYACLNECAEITARLLEAGALAMPNKAGQVPLDIAFEKKSEALLCVYSQHVDLSLNFAKNSTIFHYMASMGWIDLWKIVYKQSQNKLFEGLFGNVIAQQDAEKKSALHHALYQQHNALALHIVKQYIELKLNLCQKDDQGNTPLHLALQMNFVDLATLLVAYLQGEDFASSKWKNRSGKIPIDYVHENPALSVLFHPLKALGRKAEYETSISIIF
jgi:ankyrin repeat protein